MVLLREDMYLSIPLIFKYWNFIYSMVINRYLNYQSIPKQVKDIITQKSYNDMVNLNLTEVGQC